MNKQTTESFAYFMFILFYAYQILFSTHNHNVAWPIFSKCIYCLYETQNSHFPIKVLGTELSTQAPKPDYLVRYLGSSTY